MKYIILSLVFFINPALLSARGGGGCLEKGVKVLTPSGEVPVETLKAGDRVTAENNGTMSESVVRSVYAVEAGKFIEIKACGKTVSATPTHPFMTGEGVFKEAGFLKAGEKVYLSDGNGASECVIDSAKESVKRSSAYNLLVYPYGKYVAGGLVVHNKGCFLPDTFILKADGSRTAISEIKEGDRLLSFDRDGKTVKTEVREIIKLEAEEYYEIKTPYITVKATAEHPFYAGGGVFRTVESLSRGDKIYVYDGSGLSASPIVSIEKKKGRVAIYNLKTDSPNTFFANYAAVHNKGGGGYHGSRGSSGPSSPGSVLFMFIVFGIALLFKTRGEDSVELDYIFPRSEIERKALKTGKLLNFLAKQDENFKPEFLVETTKKTFENLQICWTNREYLPMKDLMMEHLFVRHESQLSIMKTHNEINVMEDVKILAVDITGLRYGSAPENKFFTALITARARDYYIDDRDNSFLRGDKSSAEFQEFWTFRLMGGKWLLDKIEQTAESDCLAKEDFMEAFTDDALSQIYGEDISKVGPAGPYLASPVLEKGVKIARMINFLGESDKMWDMARMEIDASLAFIKVYEAWAKGDGDLLSKDALFPETLENLKALIEKQKQEGLSLEFRNLCIRKVDVVLVNNKTGENEDEFVIRISAHAQKKMTKGGAVIIADEYVSPFSEYWVFGKHENKWKLKEILAKGAGENALSADNKDEDSSPAQLEWYYTKKRPY